MPGENRDTIRRIEEGLYSPNAHEVPIGHELSSRRAPRVEEDWKDDGFNDGDFASPGVTSPMKKSKSFVKIFLIAALVFFGVAVGYGAWKMFGGSTLSSKDVVISVEGPGTAGGGEAFTFTVVVSNKNSTDVESADLAINLPDGMVDVSDPTKSAVTIHKTFTHIVAGGEQREQVSVVAFGAQGEEKKVPLSLDFRFAGQSATWESKSEYSVTVTSSPVNLTVETTNEVNAGQEFDLDIKVVSNTDKQLDGLLLKIDYPQGFQFHGASPNSTYGQNLWSVGSLKPGEATEVRIRGATGGDEGEQEIFTITLGAQDPKDTHLIATTYNAITQTVTIKKPFLSVDMEVDGDHDPTHAADSGKTLNVSLNWQNTIDSKIVDAELDVKINGQALDRYSVSTGGQGFYRSSDNTVVWTKGDTPELSVIDPGSSGTVSFSFRTITLSSDQGKLFKNPTITLEVSAKGHRVSDTNVPESISTFLTRTIALNTNFNFASRAIYFGSSPFTNSGPMPPKAEKETAYTVIWTLANSANDISGATVRTSLPVYARFVGTVSPVTGTLSNPIGQDIVWDVGTIKAGAGVTAPPREVAFQIAITPSLSQVERVVNLTDSVMFTGTDTFTQTSLSDTKTPLTTRITTDPQFQNQDAFITQ